ncbi:vesicle-associated protein 2-2 [Diplogelasinospora grovesii]|uniref:Vesicle-associated protein 2-2 n=1 Tax=Diplogelasinospora grovesii TaxID=303347 RepID=A0AAN6NDI9_9PEZI|nr:vesicle-associated protein 2-2 [Diplogelasinospora grovesii]
MSVEIDPLELGFRRPFTVEVAQILKIKNPNTSPVAFKVKTTAPKQYCVRPNSGRIEPGKDVEVSVLLQAMKQEPPLDARCRDKFLVQSVAITGDKEFTNVQQIWDSVEKSAVQEKKIRVNWLPPSGEGHADAAVTPLRHTVTNGVDGTPDVPPPAYSSPSPDNAMVDSKSVSEPETTQKDTKEEPETVPSTIVGSTVQAAKNTTTEGYEEVKAQLAQAQATIVSLKNDAAAGLRQRKVGTSGSDDKSAGQGQSSLARAERQVTEGVPVQVVAILCLLCFLLGYFLF